jgi:hypothetical protein
MEIKPQINGRGIVGGNFCRDLCPSTNLNRPSILSKLATDTVETCGSIAVPNPSLFYCPLLGLPEISIEQQCNTARESLKHGNVESVCSLDLVFVIEIY